MNPIRWSIYEGRSLCQQEETKVNLTHGCWNRSICLTWPMQLQVLGDLKAVSAGANTSLMKALSSSIIAQLVFDCLNALGNNIWDSESYRQAYTAGNTQNWGKRGQGPLWSRGRGSYWGGVHMNWVWPRNSGVRQRGWVWQIALNASIFTPPCIHIVCHVTWESVFYHW